MPTEKRRSYTAPALEKGLDLLELLAEARVPLTTQAMADALSRSRSEIFRMVNVLEERQFIAREGSEEGFVLTSKLLELAMQNPPTRSLLEAALPVMEELANAAGQSCHLAVESGADMVVIARVESPGEVGFAVRIGHRRSLVDATSGRVLLAFQEPEPQRAWLARIPRALRQDPDELQRDLALIRRTGIRRAKSSFVRGIEDLGVPVFDGRVSGAVAALTIPCVQTQDMPCPVAEVIRLLRAAGHELSTALAQRTGRVLPLEAAS